MKQKAEHMTKKHFIKLAHYIRQWQEFEPKEKFTQNQIHQLARFCADVNPQFKMDRWKAYIRGECGKNGGQIKSK